MEQLIASLVLIVILFLLLGGGFWVAFSLMGVGFAGMAIFTDAPAGQVSHELLQEIGALNVRQLAGQGYAQLVDDAGIRSQSVLPVVHPGARLDRFIGHVVGEDFGFGVGAADIANMRPCRARLMGRAANTLKIATIDGHTHTLTANANKARSACAPSGETGSPKRQGHVHGSGAPKPVPGA